MADYIHFGSGHLYQVWSIGEREARLDYLRNGLTGEEVHFERYEPFILLTLPADAYHAAIQPVRELRSVDFELQGVRRQASGHHIRLSLSYQSEALRAVVTYEHETGQNWIRKRVHVENRSTAVYIVGIVLQDWQVRDTERVEGLDCGYRFAYPAYGTSRTPDQYVTRLGMPAIVWSRHGGLLAGIEFPGSHTEVAGVEYRCDYRPGMQLGTGESLDSEPAVVLAFAGKEFAHARDAFTHYLTAAYPPRVPSPARFNTVGAWLEHATEERILATLPAAKEMGIDVYVIDFGWSQYDAYPFSFGKPEALPPVEQVEQGFWRRELFPSGLARIKAEADNLGIRMGLHYETSGFPHLEEIPEWELKGTINQGYCLCTGYGDQFHELVLHQVERYGLGEIKLDFFTTEPCTAAGHDHRPDGYDSSDKQVLRILELMRKARHHEPDLVISLFTGGGYTSPWWLRYADQLHSGDPGHNVMFRAMLEDNSKSHAMALERRDRWHWATGQGMRPAHCIQMDVHGYGIQATGSVGARMDRDQDDSIPLGAGWKQTLFSNLALTQVRDIKVNPWYLSLRDRQFVQRWLEWGRQNAGRLMRPQSLFGIPTGQELEGYAHVHTDGGYVFLMNSSPNLAPVELRLHEVFGPGQWRVDCLYPEERYWGEQGIAVAVAPKDCVVLEVTSTELARKTGIATGAEEYSNTAQAIQRPHEPLVVPQWSELLQQLMGRTVFIEDDDRGRRPWEERLRRQVARLLDVATIGGVSKGVTAAQDAVLVEMHARPGKWKPDDEVGGFAEALGAPVWRLPDGRLIDGCVIMGSASNGHLERLVLASTAPEHLLRALNHGELVLSTLRGLRTTEVLDDPDRYEVVTSADVVSPISPLHSRSVRFLSPYADTRPFALADVVMGSSIKLGKPASRRRGFLFQSAPGGEVAARATLRVPSSHQQVVLRFDIGIVDQMAPSFGVSLSDRCTGVRFVLDIESDNEVVTVLDELVFPELYPSGEMLEYPELLPDSLHNDFLRPMMVDVTRWVGQEIQLGLRVTVDSAYLNLHCFPIWTPPQILAAS